MLELNKVYNMDCIEFMKTLPDKCIDLVLTDPPYGIGMNKHFGNGANEKMVLSDEDWDTQIPPKEYFDEIFRISKNQIIWGGNYFTQYLPPKMCRLIWDKNNGESTFSDGEMAWTSFDTALRIKKVHCTGGSMGYTEDTKGKVHPTQKPKLLFEWILENYSKEGDIVFDCFAGSGTTGVACKEMGRQYILVEKEPKYVEIINKRLDNTTISLFH